MVEQQTDAVTAPESLLAERESLSASMLSSHLKGLDLVPLVDDAAEVTSQKSVEGEQNVGLGFLKCGIEATGDTIADLEQSSATQKQNHQNEITEVKEEPQAVAQDSTPAVVNTIAESQKPPQAQLVEEEDKQQPVADDHSEVMAEKTDEEVNSTTKISSEESSHHVNGDSVAVESINSKDPSQISVACVDLEENVAPSADDEDLLDDEEIEIEEEIEVDDSASMESGSQADVTGETKKKKKLRIFKKIKRGTKAVVIDAPKAVAYGALFSAGALVGSSIVGGKAVGHGAVTGTKAIGQGTMHGVQAISQGTKELARNAAHAVVDGSRAGAEFVSETGDKFVVGTKEFANNVADGAVKVVTKTKSAVVDGVEATAYGALYGAGAVIGGTKAVGHGVVDGTTKIATEARDTAACFAKAYAGAVGDIAHGAKTGVCAVANIADRAKTAVGDKTREAFLNAAQAALDGAQFAGYKVEGGNSVESRGGDTKSISSNSSKISKESKSSK